MTAADRPATYLWAAADRERQLVRSVQEAEWRRRMLRAGNIDADQLSNQARRILVWLAEWDDWTVDGVAELLAAAHRSGLDAGRPAPTSGTRHATGTTAPEPGAPTTDQGPNDAPDARPAERGLDGTNAGTAMAGTRQVPVAGDDPVSARLAALQRRPESPAVGL